MIDYGRAVSAPGLMMLCIRQESPLAGDIYHRYSTDPVPFTSEFDVMEKIDKLCDEIGYPSRVVAHRSFRRSKAPARKNYREAQQAMSFSELSKKTGEEGTFMVHIQFRQNATWQGQVTWVDKKKTMQFRSALELMKLIDSALAEEESEE